MHVYIHPGGIKATSVTAFCSSPGEKPFECGICGKTFGQSAHLNKHKAKHSGIDEDLAIIRAASKEKSRSSNSASTTSQSQSQQQQQSKPQTSTPTPSTPQPPPQVPQQGGGGHGLLQHGGIQVVQNQVMSTQLQSLAMPMTLPMGARGPFFYHALHPDK